MLFIHRLSTIRKMYEKLPRPVSVLHYQESEIEIKIFYFQVIHETEEDDDFLNDIPGNIGAAYNESDSYYASTKRLLAQKF